MEQTNGDPAPERAPEQSPKRRRGRPSKLTPEVEARIFGAVRCAAPDHVACAAAGIAPSTLTLWQRRARDPNAPRQYRRFAKRLAAARHEGNVGRLAMMHKAAQTDWRAAAWLLERTLPRDFSPRQRVEHSGGIRALPPADPEATAAIASVPGLLDKLDDIAERRIMARYEAANGAGSGRHR